LTPVSAVSALSNLAAAIWSGIETAAALRPSTDADAGWVAASAMLEGVNATGHQCEHREIGGLMK